MKVVLHVGLNKTASTMLQRDVFPHLDDVELIERANLRQTTNQITGGSYVPGALASLVADRAGAGALVVSDEGYTSTLRHSRWSELERTADRLADEVPEAEILLVGREPARLLVSSYAQYLKLGGTLSWSRFLTRWDARVFDVSALVELYRERFRVVHVLAFEELSSPDRFANSLLGAVGATADPAEISVWLGERRNTSLSPILGFLELGANWLLSAVPPQRRAKTERRVRYWLRRLDAAADTRGWAVNRRLAERRRQEAESYTAGFRYPP